MSPLFAVNNGVKQSCVLSPKLFRIYLAAVLDEAFSDTTQGIYLQTRPGANLFNLILFKSNSRTQLTMLPELMYAVDTALIAHSLEDMQVVTSRFTKAVPDFRLCINIRKTEVMYKPCAHTTERFRIIQIEDDPLENVSRFTYLGSTITHDGSLDTKLQTRMCKVSVAFEQLREKLWILF